MSQPKFNILHEEQSALLKAITDNGFVEFVPTDKERHLKAVYKDKAAEAFQTTFGAFKQERDKHNAALNAKAEQLVNAASGINSAIVDLGKGGLSSDYGYFLCAAGASQMPPAYISLPDYYAKIEKGIKSHPEIQGKWEHIKTLANEVVVLQKEFPDVNLDYLRSIEAVSELFLFDIPANGKLFPYHDFFSRPNTFVKYPIEANTKAEVGEKAVEILKTCADKITRFNSKNDKAMALVQTVRDFADALEAKGWSTQFAELNQKKAASPSLPGRE